MPPAMLDPIAIVGLSYMLFRRIHYVVDRWGQSAPSLWDYLNYQMTCWAAGRSRCYQFRFMGSTGDRRDRPATCWYLRLLGRGESSALPRPSPLPTKLFARLGRCTRRPYMACSLPVLFLRCSTFTAVSRFSGYCDIVIGGARWGCGCRRTSTACRAAYHSGRWHHRARLLDSRLPLHADVRQLPSATPGGAFGVGCCVAFALAGIWHHLEFLSSAPSTAWAPRRKLGERSDRKRGRAGLRQCCSRAGSAWSRSGPPPTASASPCSSSLTSWSAPDLRVLYAALEAAIRG